MCRKSYESDINQNSLYSATVCNQEDSWISAVLSCVTDEQSLCSFQMSPLSFHVKTYAQLNLVTAECHTQKSVYHQTDVLFRVVENSCCLPWSGGQLMNTFYLISSRYERNRLHASFFFFISSLLPYFLLIVYCHKELSSFQKTTSAVSSRNWTEAWAKAWAPKATLICSPTAAEDAGDLTWISSRLPSHLAPGLKCGGTTASLWLAET